MPFPDRVPPEKREVLHLAVEALSAVPGMVAVVLGGSYARGTQHATSDLDLGLYYSEAAPFAIADIRTVAERLAEAQSPVVTGLYEWGPWVNGGAWIHTAAGKVDFLYRSIEHVERTIREAQQGVHAHHYAQQPAFGFYSVIYLAETDVCVPLFDPQGVLARLKRDVAAYPPRLRQAVTADALWSAEFTLVFARGRASAGDVYGTAGSLARVAASLTQALYALNSEYFIADKGALEAMSQFERCPAAYVERLTSLLAHPGKSSGELATSVRDVTALWQEVVALTDGAYVPKYALV